MILVQTQILLCNNKRILVIQIPRGLHKLYAVNRTDVWVKSGSDKRKAPIERNLHRIQTTDDFNDPGTMEIPQKVFSEILANAIIHRNYYIQAPIQVHLFAGRLEIESPGDTSKYID